MMRKLSRYFVTSNLPFIPLLDVSKSSAVMSCFEKFVTLSCLAPAGGAELDENHASLYSLSFSLSSPLNTFTAQKKV